MTLYVVNDRRVLQLGTVFGEIDLRRLRGEEIKFPSRVVIALFEGEQSGGGLALEAEGGGDFGPVEFGGCGALFWRGKGES